MNNRAKLNQRKQNAGKQRHKISRNQRSSASARLLEILVNNRRRRVGGTYAVCSAHPAVIEAAVQQSLNSGSLLHIESTSSQVNQFGGYTGTTPAQFANWIGSAAKNAGLPAERVLLGGDHLGPFPWRNEASASALEKASKLVRDCVAAGYQKIHLDASMACADDSQTGISEETIAARAALLCRAAEQAHRELPSGSPQPLYVVGTEVPAPGGELNESGAPSVTKARDVHRTLKAFQSAFAELDLEPAWERVIALVVQPGVEFGADSIFEYDSPQAKSLTGSLSRHEGIVFEAHSTDYQSPKALRKMVEDHFAILKVGPWLTFAFREAVLALSAIEGELFAGNSSGRRSQVREALESAMLGNPSYWRSYYHGKEDDVRRDRIYGYSDRCRYYWADPGVKKELDQLLANLTAAKVPLTLISQYLPHEYEAIRTGILEAAPREIVQHRILRVLRIYSDACSITPSD